MIDSSPATQLTPSKTLQSKSRRERETVIIFNEADQDASLWTGSLREANRWLRLGLQVTADNGGWRALIAKTAVKLRNPIAKRSLSEAHKAALVAGRQARRQGAITSNQDVQGASE